MSMSECYIWLLFLISVILVTVKSLKTSTTVVKLKTAFQCYVINHLLHHRRFETHTQIYMSIQDEVKCDKLSPAGPVIEFLVSYHNRKIHLWKVH